MCNLHNPHHTGNNENHKQHIADLQLVALFKQKSSAIAKHYKNMHGAMPQGLLKRFDVLKKCRKFECLVYEMLFIRVLKPNLKRAIRLHSCESIFIIVAPSYVNSSRQNRFKCCNLHDHTCIYIFLDNGVMNIAKRRFLSFVITVLSFKKSPWCFSTLISY